MKIIKKKRHAVLIVLILILSVYLAMGMFTVKGVFTADKAYMHEPPGADITIVDFNQFGCDMCQEAHPVLKEAMAQDSKVRYIPRIIIRDGHMEKEAVHATYASAEQGKFIQMHHAIYEGWPIKTRGELFSIAEKLGLDIEQLQVDMDSEKVKQKIQEESNHLETWRLPSVPAYLIDQKIMYIPNRGDTPTVEDWLDRFKRVRNQ